MDDGYWVSLLRDVEEEFGPGTHDSEPDELSASNGVAGLAFHLSHWGSASAAGNAVYVASDDEVWDRMESRMAHTESCWRR